MEQGDRKRSEVGTWNTVGNGPGGDRGEMGGLERRREEAMMESGCWTGRSGAIRRLSHGDTIILAFAVELYLALCYNAKFRRAGPQPVSNWKVSTVISFSTRAGIGRLAESQHQIEIPRSRYVDEYYPGFPWTLDGLVISYRKLVFTTRPSRQQELQRNFDRTK